MHDLRRLAGLLARFAHHRTRVSDRRPPLAAHGHLLKAAARHGHLRLDPIRRLGWTLGEHRVRDVLAELFDPAERHGLGPAALVVLLDAALRRPGASRDVKERLRRLRALARRGAYRVRPEFPVRSGRIDIAVQSPELLLYIELKRAGGVETWSQGRAPGAPASGGPATSCPGTAFRKRQKKSSSRRS